MNSIKKLRLGRRLTVKQFSEKSGIPASSIYDWESGRQIPGIKNRKKLELFFNFSIDADPKVDGSHHGVIVSANPNGEIVYGDGVKIFPRRNDYHEHEK